ncbi:MAG TPA: hypothetical protein VGO62_14935 [Myxococcota bacterium]|jgi:hypothetical protein
MTEKDEKTVMPEVLPAPMKVDSRSPRARARFRLQALAKKAALAGAAGSLSACLGYGVVDEVPRPVQCTANDDINDWLRATVGPATAPAAAFTVTITTGEGFRQVLGIQLSTLFVVDDGVVTGQPRFNGNDLASSTTVSVDLVPNAGATEIVLHTALSCDDVPRNIAIHIDVTNLVVSSIVDLGAP